MYFQFKIGEILMSTICLFFVICCCQWNLQQQLDTGQSRFILWSRGGHIFINNSIKNFNYPCSKLYWLVLRHRRIALVFDRWHDTSVNPVFRLLCRNCSHPERRTEVKHNVTKWFVNSYRKGIVSWHFGLVNGLDFFN